MKIVSCKEVTEQANDYINGDLPVSQRLALFLHLVICRCCRHYLHQLHKTIDFVIAIHPQEQESNTDLSELAEKLHKLHHH